MHAQPPTPPHAAHVTPYDRLTWPAETAERLLASGEQERDLIAYFGEAAYAELRRLAQRVHAHAVRADDRVYILPGIMGSQLGLARVRPLPDDVIWVDPLDIAIGRIIALQTAPGSKIIPLGVLLYNYMKLRLTLRAAGFDAVFHDYDWRLGVDVLGAALATRLAADRSPRIAIVAHSMGGLVARAALRSAGMSRIRRLVMLGTPNRGSFAPVQAFRGSSPVVRRIASLDHRHSAEQLAERVFSGFTSLYHMLPAPGSPGAPDLLDPRSWPSAGPRPHAQRLAEARGVQAALAPPDDRFRLVVGVGEETVTGVELDGSEFRYRSTLDGDGYVPLQLALLEGVPTRYTTVLHGELPQHDAVIAAVCDLLERGSTSRLQGEPAPQARRVRSMTDTDLRRALNDKIDWARLTPEERRRFLDRLNEPPVL